MIRLQTFAQPRRFDRGQPVVNIMKQMKVVPELQAQCFEQLGNVQKIFLSRPGIFGRQSFFRRLVVQLVVRNSVRGGQARNPRLRAHGKISHLFILRDFLPGLLNIATIGVPVHQHSCSALPSEQVIDGRLQGFPLDIPEGHVDGSNRRHGYGAAAPVRARGKDIATRPPSGRGRVR